MRGTTLLDRPLIFAIALNLFGCGYSQDEWDQKVRETEELRSNLAGEKSARAKAEADYADALEEIDALRAKVNESGMNMDSLSADLEAQKKALMEYEQRLAILGQMRARFEQCGTSCKSSPSWVSRWTCGTTAW
jgi:septal ring factor EnvC (AmiA/AmiB activator)